MSVVFEKGQKVYDQVIFPDKEGMVMEILEGESYPVSVKVDGYDDWFKYTSDGRYLGFMNRTLSVKPYTLQGFERKEIIPTFKEAEKWFIENNTCEVVLRKPDYFVHYTESENHTTFEALRKLTILRDFYNKGWKPDWSNEGEIRCCIRVKNNSIIVDNNLYINEFNTILVFKDYIIRNKFLKEQRELLEIAKPLL